jgi:hypothetical protein
LLTFAEYITSAWHAVPKLAVLESAKTRVSRRLAFMARQIIPEPLIDALIEQDPHERGGLVVRDENL